MDVSRHPFPCRFRSAPRAGGGGEPYPRLRRLRAFIGLLIVSGLGTATVVEAQNSREYDVKAVLLLNLTRFVEWPPATFADAGAPFVVGILGQDPFGQVLDEVVRSESYRRHKIQVVRCRDLASTKGCQILFIGVNEGQDFPRTLSGLRGLAVLTVGDFEEFASRGGMVALNQGADGKIRLRINLDAIRSGGLVVSGKLLRVAEIVKVGKN